MVMEMNAPVTGQSGATFSVDARDLKAALAYLAPCVRRPNVPVMGGVLIESDGFGVKISAHNYDEFRSAALVGGGEAGRALVPHAALSALAKAATTGLSRADQPPTIIELAGTDVTVSTGRSRATLRTLPIDDYPAFGGTFAGQAAHVPVSALAGAAAMIAPALGVDATLPMLMHVLLRGDGDGLRLTATNRYLMADTRVAGHTPVCHWLVPGKALADASKVMAKATPGAVASITHDSDGNRVRIECGRYVLAVALYAVAQYPTALDQLWPAERAGDETRTLNVADIIGAVKRVAAGQDKKMPVRLTFDAGDQIRVECGDAESNAVELVTGEHGRMAGDESMTVAFNPAYLISSLAAPGTPTVEALIAEPVKPVVFRAATGPARVLIMPIRIPR